MFQKSFLILPALLVVFLVSCATEEKRGRPDILQQLKQAAVSGYKMDIPIRYYVLQHSISPMVEKTALISFFFVKALSKKILMILSLL